MKAVFFAFLLLAVLCLYLFFPLRYYSVVKENCGSMDPLLVMSLIKVESNFKEDAVSRAGAVGLMQLMPKTAAWICERAGISGEIDITSPVDNIVIGIEYLRYLINLYDGNIDLALRAYNAGPARVDSQNVIAKEYLLKIKSYYRIYRLLYFWVR